MKTIMKKKLKVHKLYRKSLNLGTSHHQIWGCHLIWGHPQIWVASPIGESDTIICMYFTQILVIIDAKPKDLGLPTEAYIAVEEVHDVSMDLVV